LRTRREKSNATDSVTKSRMDRLRNSKLNVSDDLDKQRASTQFEPEQDFTASSTSAADAFGANDLKSNRTDAPLANQPSMGVEEEQSYTSRLLEAKRKAKKNT
jgi:hypothetical protein